MYMYVVHSTCSSWVPLRTSLISGVNVNIGDVKHYVHDLECRNYEVFVKALHYAVLWYVV